MRRAWAWLCLATALVGAGCKPAPAKRYPMQGEVISADVQRAMVIVKHGDIPGVMPAMTMSYQVEDPKEIAALKSGDTITAELVIVNDLGHLEKITLVQKASPPATSPAAEAPGGGAAGEGKKP